MGKQKTQTYKKEYDKRTEERGKSGGGTCKGNDPAWYNHNPELVNAAANLFFSDPLGNSVDDGGISNPVTGSTLTAKYDRVPGILAIGVVPTPGMASDANSVVNVAANNIYSYVRHANSGHSNYDAPDLMMYITAMDSLYSALAHVIRIYGVINYYDAMNKYVPDSLLLALGVLPEEYLPATTNTVPNNKIGAYLRANKANILTWINVMVTKLSSRAIPGNMDLFARHAFMYSGVWKDSANVKSQLYAFVPEGFWKYSGYTDRTGGRCYWEPYRTVSSDYVGNRLRGLPFTKLQQTIERMAAAVLEDEDMGIMSGDVLKVYGEGGIYKFAMVPQEFEVVPKYDESVLAQIENTTLCGSMIYFDNSSEQDPSRWEYANPTLMQDPNTNLITFDIQLAAPEIAVKNSLVNCRFDNPTPMDTLYHTRNTVAVTCTPVFNGSGIPLGTHVKPVAFGTEICTTAEVYMMTKEDGVMSTYVSKPFTSMISGYGKTATAQVPYFEGASFEIGEYSDGKSYYGDAYLLDQFDWHPILRPANHRSNEPGKMNTFVGPYFGDIDNYAILSPEVLRRIHEVAVISLYDLPSQG